MTEANMITSNPYDGERRAGTVGRPLGGVSVRVVGQFETSLDAGVIGSIQVRGPNVFRGYWGAPDKTAEEFTADGYLRTGDLGFIDEKNYLTIVGRSKDLVISGGYNVYPKEVEAEIDMIPGVLESAVVGVPNADLGEEVVAAVVVQQEAAVGPPEIPEWLDSRIARYKQPKRIVIVAELPRNTIGKVQKNILREQLRQGL